LVLSKIADPPGIGALEVHIVLSQATRNLLELTRRAMSLHAR
jgi:hypothetical protein